MRTGFWVFCYGSLMWRPGFEPEARQVARLDGYARRFCLQSVHYRGTPEAPGLVLALDAVPGGSCTGIALRVPEAGAEEIYAYLIARELVTSAYAEAWLPVTLADGQVVRALAYVSDPGHPQYCADLGAAAQAAIIASAAGPAGTNHDYLSQTLAHLRAEGILDAELEAIAAAVEALAPG